MCLFRGLIIAMLVSLRVRNLALVDQAELAFGSGVNVITGETGAGKSILVGALNLLLGARADRGDVRTGESSASAEAVFRLPGDSAIHGLLDAHGVTPCEGGQLILRRMVRASGTGQSVINDSMVTVQLMKEVGRLLVDLHGPHDHQSLFDPEFQLEVLDAYGRHPAAREAHAAAFSALRDLEKRREALEGTPGDVAAQVDLLSYRIRELEEAALDPGEEAAIEREHVTQAHAQEIRRLGQEIAEALMESEGAAFDALAAAQRSIEELGRLMPETEEWKKEAESAAVTVQELYRTIQGAVDGIEADPARLQWLEERLSTYQKMKRKYGPTIEEVLAALADSKDRLQDLSSREERLAALEEEIARAADRARQTGAALRKKRRAAAKRFAGEVTSELRSLGFTHGELTVQLSDTEMGPSGVDNVEFGFAPNVGEAMRPLRAIASSGEISRVMLATKGVLAGLDRIPVLVFDEIDVNVGGEMGAVVGRKLGGLAAGRQVICITHLPQVAVHGAAHFAVRKEVREGRTFTEVVRLSAGERVEEVARMLGGKGQTSVTLEHARQMLKGAR